MQLYQIGTPRRGMEHIAQGNALGTNDKRNFRPERAKELILNAFALSGREMAGAWIYPGRCPGLVACCPFRALIAVKARFFACET